MIAFPLTDVKAGAYQAGGRLSANVGPSVSVRQAGLFGVFHSSAHVGGLPDSTCWNGVRAISERE